MKPHSHRLNQLLLIVLLVVLPGALSAQLDSLASKLKFEGDFRFRVEEDWNSKRSDGTLRDNRTRFRYRLRAGVEYADKWYKTGFRIRTGDPRKQQDPQLTLGEGYQEFGLLPIGLEKAYFQGHWSSFNFWVGKNTFPFEKSNELFWSDNVFPEGLFAGKGFSLKSSVLDSLDIRAGHFILAASGRSLDQDAYVQGIQTYTSLFKNQIEFFPALYHFHAVPDIPDGGETFTIDYTIAHLGSRLHLLKKPTVKVEIDYYYNLQDYAQNDSIAPNLRNQKTGLVVGLKYGGLKQKGDWRFEANYAYLERFAAVDIMAQNDWARWDYSAFGSPDGRLTNLNGIEIVAGYKPDKRVNLIAKYYLVEQLIAYGPSKETGSRFRLDLDVTF